MNYPQVKEFGIDSQLLAIKQGKVKKAGTGPALTSIGPVRRTDGNGCGHRKNKKLNCFLLFTWEKKNSVELNFIFPT